MAGFDELGDLFEEMEEIQDCGVSSFDDDDSDTVDDFESWLRKIVDGDLESSSRDVSGDVHTRSESSHDLHYTQRQAPSTTNEQNQLETPPTISSVVAAGTLSSGSVQNTRLFNFTTSATHPQLAKTSTSRQTISRQRDDNYFTMSGSNQRPIEDSSDSQFNDDTDYQFPQLVFQTEEEEDFSEDVLREISRLTAERSEELPQLPQKSPIEPDTTNRQIVWPSTSNHISSKSDPTVDHESQRQPSSQATPDPSIPDTQEATKSAVPSHLVPSQISDSTQRTHQTESQVQSEIQQVPTKIYEGTNRDHNIQTPTPSAASPNRAALQKMATQIYHSNDPSVQNLLQDAPGVDLSEPRLTDRCRGMEYIPFRQREELNRLHSDHNEAMKEINIRLRSAIRRRLGGTEAESVETDLKVATIESFLFVKATHVLRSHFPDNDRLFADLGTWNRETAQLTLLHRLLQRIDLTIRPNGPVHVQNSLDAWYVAALKWQQEIYEDWIKELGKGKKRRTPDDEEDTNNDDDERSVKKARKDSSGRKDEKPTRKPGRPPGSLNKSTIAARLKLAAKVDDEEQRMQMMSLPEPTQEEVRSAQASATRYARARSRPASRTPVLSNPQIDAAATAPATALTQSPLHGQGRREGQVQSQYQPRPQLQPYQFRPGCFLQAMPHFVQPVSHLPIISPNPTSIPQSVYYQPAKPYGQMQQAQPRSQSLSQILAPNIGHPQFQSPQHPYFPNYQMPSPGPRYVYPYPSPTSGVLPQLTTQQYFNQNRHGLHSQLQSQPQSQPQPIYPSSRWMNPVPPPTARSTSMTVMPNLTNSTDNTPSTESQQPGNNNNNDNKEENDDNDNDIHNNDDDGVHDPWRDIFSDSHGN